jgi:gentisate 1,2-dioxygenase
MAENELTRVRERGAKPFNTYEKILKTRQEFQERQNIGQVVIKQSDRQFAQNRQARTLHFLNPDVYKNTPLQDWLVFVNDIRTHTGKHRHQGGMVIYVIEGEGYSIVDGERKNWKTGDLLLLPIKPEGVVHQHFNSVPGQSCKWLAFIYYPIMDHLAMEMVPMETSPDYKE